jgi:hypothetical protein
MALCILSGVNQTVQANMAAGSAVMGLLPTAVVLLASTIEDVVTIARRDPWLGFLMGVVSWGCKRAHQK